MGSEEGVCRALVCESVYKYMRERMCAFMSVCRRVCLCESVDILGTAGLASPEWPRCSGICTVCVLALNPAREQLRGKSTLSGSVSSGVELVRLFSSLTL